MNPWLLAVLFVLALGALAVLIRAVVRMLRAARLCDVPLRPRQQIEFPAAGKIILCMEGPRFTPRFRKLRFELRQPGGAEIAGQRILFRTVASGLSHARVTLRTYDLPMAGRYDLAIDGLEPQHIDAPEHAIVFMRPHLARTVLLVIGITLASMLAISSLVFFLLIVLPTAAAIDPGRSTGYVQYDATRIELREAYAHLHRGTSDGPPQPAELRIVLSNREVPQELLAGTDTRRLLELTHAGKVYGIFIQLHPDDPGTLALTVLTPPRTGQDTLITQRYFEASRSILRNLRLSSQRVGGDLTCPTDPDLECAAHFSAPLFTD
jgi:hypothetical protein